MNIKKTVQHAFFHARVCLDTNIFTHGINSNINDAARQHRISPPQAQHDVGSIDTAEQSV